MLSLWEREIAQSVAARQISQMCLYVWSAMLSSSNVRHIFTACYIPSNKYNRVVWKTHFHVFFQGAYLLIQFSRFRQAGTRGTA